MDLKDRKQKKVARKTDYRGCEFATTQAEFALDKKASDETGTGDGFVYFEGYASITGSYDSYNDIILPGAFKETLKEKGPAEGRDSKIVSLWQHNPDWPFGLPVQMEEDSTGLWHRTMIADTTENLDRIKYMERKVVTGESIGFITTEAEWAEEDDDAFDPSSPWIGRYIKGIDLWEHSPVTFPAHSDAVTTLIQRNRELMLAVKQTDHGAILETAYKMKGVTVPQIEETIDVLNAVIRSMESQGGDGREEEEAIETSGNDPELVKELERIAAKMELELIADRMARR